MKASLSILWLSASLASAWTMRDGRTFEAELAAADGLRATFSRPGKTPVVMPLASLSASDAETIHVWRRNHRRPLVIPARLAPWPANASAPAGDVRLLAEVNGAYVCESANFRITSDLKLPLNVLNDIAKVFEATRATLIAIPLGLHAGGERERYQVAMFRDENGYTRAGGNEGSGGHYDGRTKRMLVLLPNLGIDDTSGTLRLDHTRNLFILKHEVTHQLMDRWHGPIPTWLDEGIAEFIASLPYSKGHYTISPPGAGMRDYLTKWNALKNDRSLRIIAPDRLMAMDRKDWNAAVKELSAYDLYNSSAILTYHFIQQNNGAPIAGFLDSLRRGEKPSEAELKHLLPGKSRETLNAEVVSRAKSLGLEPEILQP